MSKTRKRTADDSRKMISRLQEEYPEVYKRLVTKKKSPMPEKKRIALYNKALILAQGAEVTIPVQRGSFRAQARLYWECADCTGIEVLRFQPNVKASPRAEKSLLKTIGELIDGNYYYPDHLVEEIREDIWKSAPCRSFQKKVEALQKEFDACEAAYDFDYDRDIGVETDN